MPIFATISGVGQIREPGQIGVAEFDTYLPLMSLPHVFKTTLDTIPATVPYIDAAALRGVKRILRCFCRGRTIPESALSGQTIPTTASIGTVLVRCMNFCRS